MNKINRLFLIVVSTQVIGSNNTTNVYGFHLSTIDSRSLWERSFNNNGNRVVENVLSSSSSSSLSFVRKQSKRRKIPYLHLQKYQQQQQQEEISKRKRTSKGIWMSDRAADEFADYISAQPTIDSIPTDNDNDVTLYPWEHWLWSTLDTKYSQSLQIKCPFFRRRAADILDTADTIFRSIVVQQHQSMLPAPASWRQQQQQQNHQTTTTIDDTKQINLSIDELIVILKRDWHIDTNNKGYYITGRLTKGIYRDDCYFDGPDADMPIRGLRKYLNAASQLFEYKTSIAELVSIKAGTGTTTTTTTTTNDNNANNANANTIVATWKMSAVLRLPWKPRLPQVQGETTYYLDESNLIYKHVETWDRSAFQAFVETFWPKIATILYIGNSTILPN